MQGKGILTFLNSATKFWWSPKKSNIIYLRIVYHVCNPSCQNHVLSVVLTLLQTFWMWIADTLPSGFLQLCLPSLVCTLHLCLNLCSYIVCSWFRRRLQIDLCFVERVAEYMDLHYSRFCLKYSLTGTSWYTVKLRERTILCVISYVGHMSYMDKWEDQNCCVLRAFCKPCWGGD